ncbi:hypothetical protein BM1374166_00203 [Bartonella tribocorum]|nr:hypothetical protein BM1374166_00203 [Bartonella tribocorum]
MFNGFYITSMEALTRYTLHKNQRERGLVHSKDLSFKHTCVLAIQWLSVLRKEPALLGQKEYLKNLIKHSHVICIFHSYYLEGFFLISHMIKRILHPSKQSSLHVFLYLIISREHQGKKHYL